MCTKSNFFILAKASSKFVFHLILIGKVFNVTKVFLPLDVTFAQPSAAGIPLKFMLQSVLFMHINSNVKTAVETKFLVPFQASLTGKLNSRFVNESSAVFYLQFVSQFLSLISKPQNEIGQRIMGIWKRDASGQRLRTLSRCPDLLPGKFYHSFG